MNVFLEQPSYTYVEEITHPVEKIEYESGKETRLLRGISQRTFNLNYDKVTTTTKNTLLTFFENQSGGFLSFLWTNPNDNITYEVYFLEDTFQATEVDYGYWDIKFSFIERL